MERRNINGNAMEKSDKGSGNNTKLTMLQRLKISIGNFFSKFAKKPTISNEEEKKNMVQQKKQPPTMNRCVVISGRIMRDAKRGGSFDPIRLLHGKPLKTPKSPYFSIGLKLFLGKLRTQITQQEKLMEPGNPKTKHQLIVLQCKKTFPNGRKLRFVRIIHCKITKLQKRTKKTYQNNNNKK